MGNKMTVSKTIRYPAEWETQAATWLSFPHNPKNWNGERGKKIKLFYLNLVRTITEFQPVNLILPCKKFLNDIDETYFANRPFPVKTFIIKNNDIWIRDYGPFFLKKKDKTVIAISKFNAWGNKFPPYNLDKLVPAAIAKTTGYAINSVIPYIFEGGAIEINGDGLGITTLSCLIGKNRNRETDLKKVIQSIKKAFGLRSLLVLPCGLNGDHTDGHIDNVARFVAKDRVVISYSKNLPNSKILLDARYLIETWLKNEYGENAKVDTLPLPPQRKLGDEILPASYMNFIFANNALIFPKYKSTNDALAQSYFKSLFPSRKIIGIDCRTVIEEGGSLHCLSKQECK